VNAEVAFRTEAVLTQQLRQAEKKVEECVRELVQFYSMAGRPDEAIKHADRLLALSTDPEETAACYLSLGQLMEQQRDFAAAVSFYAKAMSLEPIDRRVGYLVNNNLGYSLNQLDRYTEAEPYCRAAIRINPQRFNAYKNLGVSLQGQGRCVDAATNYLHAIEAAPTEPRAFRHLLELLKSQPNVRTELPHLEAKLRELGRILPRDSGTLP
jgi:tetratricopeptide (TPR) repeat protein